MGGPGFYKKAGLASHGEQASKQHPFMASASHPASRCLSALWVPVLVSFNDRWCRSVSQINLSSPTCFWSWGFIAATLTKTHTQTHPYMNTHTVHPTYHTYHTQCMTQTHHKHIISTTNITYTHCTHITYMLQAPQYTYTYKHYTHITHTIHYTSHHIFHTYYICHKHHAAYTFHTHTHAI